MKKFYYIEVREDQQDEKVLRRDQTTYARMDSDFERIHNQHPNHAVRMVVSSDKEKTFNYLRHEKAV